MASENRDLPRTNIKRNAAIVAGKAKQTAMGGSSFITAGTVALLNIIFPLYVAAMLLINSVKAVYFNSLTTKTAKAAACEMVCSHFMQVFYMAVKRGVFPVGDLHYYGLPANGALPDMSTDAKILAVANMLIAGDAARMAIAGAVAMSMPPIADVSTAKGALDNAIIATNTAEESVKTAQIGCNRLNTQADDCIKLLWNEVEAHYSTLPRPTMRDESRLWGVKYTRVGSTKKVTGRVTDSVTGLAIIGADIYFENGNLEASSDATGYTLDTTLMDVQRLIASHPLYTTFEQDETLVEGENPVINIVMVAL